MKILPGILNPLFLVEVTQKNFLPALIGAAGAIGGALLGKQKAPESAEPPKVNLADETKTAISVNQNNLKDIQDLVSKSNAFDQAEAIKLIESVVPGFSEITEQYTDLVRDDLRQLQDKSLPDELQQEILRNSGMANLATGAKGQAGDFNVARNLGLGQLQWMDYQNQLRQRSISTLSQITGMQPRINPMSSSAMMISPAQAISVASNNEQSRYQAQQSNFNAQAAAANQNAAMMGSAFSAAMGALGGVIGGMNFGGGVSPGASGGATSQAYTSMGGQPNLPKFNGSF